MRSAFIVDGLRTPIGRRGGSLKGIHAIDLLGLVIENLVSRNDGRKMGTRERRVR